LAENTYGQSPLEQHHKIGIENIEKMPQKLAKITQGSIKLYKIKI
jgi:hypothetical protein